MTLDTSAVTSATGRMGRSARIRRWATAIGAVVVPLSLVGLALAAIGGTDDPLDRIPAAIVNNDELVTTVDDNGDEQVILAGRGLVTELTGSNSVGFDWRPTSEAEAQRALAAGEVYAVVTIPSDFSASILAVSEPDARPASLTIETDDAHSYLAGSVMQAVGGGLVAEFGATITQQVLEGVVGGLGELGTALGEAGDGAAQLADGAREIEDGVREVGKGVDGLRDGASELGSGLGSLADGARQSATGASSLADGIAGYTGGVDQLAAGLARLNAGVQGTPSAPGLGALAEGTDGVSQLADGVLAQLAAIAPAIGAAPLPPEVQETFAGALGTAQVLADTASTVANQAGPAISGVSAGVAESAAGAGALADSSAGLRAGSRDLATGLTALADGTSASQGGAVALADGAGQLAEGGRELADGVSALADGADELAGGLQEGAAQVPASDDTLGSAVTEPVVLETVRANPLDGIGGLVVAVLGPVGLWLGALALVLALPARRAALTGAPVGAGRLLRRRLVLLGSLALGQAVIVTLLAATVAGVSWALVPALLGLTSLIALALTAVHVALSEWLGRAGAVVSLIALAAQVIVIGGVIPVDAFAPPFPALASVLPLTYAVDGMTAIIAGGDAGRITAAIVVMALTGLVSLLIARAAAGRARRQAVLDRFAPVAV